MTVLLGMVCPALTAFAYGLLIVAIRQPQAHFYDPND